MHGLALEKLATIWLGEARCAFAVHAAVCIWCDTGLILTFADLRPNLNSVMWNLLEAIKILRFAYLVRLVLYDSLQLHALHATTCQV